MHLKIFITNRIIPSVVFLLFAINSFAQNKCVCIEKPNLNELTRCDTVYLNDGSILYRLFICDSSWLTLEDKNGKKLIINTTYADMIEYTEKLGPQFVRDFQSSILFSTQESLAACWPSNFSLLSKSDGKIIRHIGKLIYFPDDTSSHFLVYFSDSTLNSITLYLADSEKSFYFQLPQNRIRETMNYGGSGAIIPEQLFKETTLENNELIIRYSYFKPNGDYLDLENESIIINLNDY